LVAGILPTNHHWAAEPESDYGTFHDGDTTRPIPTEVGGYQHYFHALAQTILHGAPNPVTPESALDNIRLILLAMQSSQEGRTLPVLA
jgi:predicted dehydrogenase